MKKPPKKRPVGRPPMPEHEKKVRRTVYLSHEDAARADIWRRDMTMGEFLAWLMRACDNGH